MNVKKIALLLLSVACSTSIFCGYASAVEAEDSEVQESAVLEETVKTEFSLEEIQAAMADGTLDDFHIAVKKGDTYYLKSMLETEEYYVSEVGLSNPNTYVALGYAETVPQWKYPEVSLAEGDQIVIFNSRDIDYSITISKVMETVYSLPFYFVYDEEEQALTVIEPVKLDFAESYVGDMLEAAYPSASIIEVNGEELSENPLWANALLCGEADQEIVLGGFEGTAFKEYTYKCNRAGYLYETKEMKSPLIGKPPMVVRNPYDMNTEMAELTKEGYAILIDQNVNTLEPGTYVLGGCLLTITE